MQKKAILVLGPVTQQASDGAGIAESLAFLHNDYGIDYIDPLTEMGLESDKQYYAKWREWIAARIPHYDAFFGFAFGGVILQQCFTVFETHKKAIVLFSSPGFADASLKSKLGAVIRLCEENKIEAALQSLYQNVFLRPKTWIPALHPLDHETAKQRLIFGLSRVLATDSREILQSSPLLHLHLIGQASRLVNKANAISAKNGFLMEVPEAGMRILEDNPDFCKRFILEQLTRVD